jgi:hypothetical protein
MDAQYNNNKNKVLKKNISDIYMIRRFAENMQRMQDGR